MKKIVIIGPESTGKSTLCVNLARHFDTRWCPEYAREYLQKNGMTYTYEDLLEIAHGQLRGEDAFIAGGHEPLLFIDTDMYVMKVWCEFAFGKCHNWILNQAAAREYDLYLLCRSDLPWVRDELREYPDLETRDRLYHYYKDIMVNQHLPWVDISGNYRERLQKAVNAVDSLLKN